MISRHAGWLGVMIAALSVSGARAAEVRKVLRIIPGSANEAALLTPGAAPAEQGSRVARGTGGWTYRLPAVAGAAYRLRYRAEGALDMQVFRPDGKPIASRHETGPEGAALSFTVPANIPAGATVSVRFQAPEGEARLQDATLTMTARDKNQNGIPDAVEARLGLASAPKPTPRPTRPMTAFQTGGPYDPTLAPPTDAVLVFSSSRDAIAGWMEAGYTVYTMGGFRDGPEYAKAHPDEVQTVRSGQPMVIENVSYYMVPTAERNRRSAAYYIEGVQNGASGVCPEEPEMFARSGYSDAFKKEWQAAYGTPWTPPDADIGSRYRAEQLKARLTVRQIDTILSSVAKAAPEARRILAVHSPVNYADWGIVMPHSELFRLPSVQEVIGQVWTGTARTPNRVAGVRAERTFELGYFEYASLVGLLKGLNKPLWMLMDPLEDNPNRSMEDYRRNYAETLTASLLFPSTSRFEVMPWPDRIYRRAPEDYVGVINNVVGALSEAWRFPASLTRAGAAGIAAVTSDTLSYQRGDPSPSDFDGVHALALPLIGHGIPLETLNLERCVEPGYLKSARVLLLSYDAMKPTSPEVHAALALWVRGGGVLALFGGTDAYDALPESWWRKAGHRSPIDDLLAQIGVSTRPIASAAPVPPARPQAQEILRGDGTERNLNNRRPYTLDLSRFVSPSGSVAVRFEDVTPEDGWGPWVRSVELRLNDQIGASFLTGSSVETRFLVEDHGSLMSGEARYADGGAYWEYRFDNIPAGSRVTLTVEMGNGFLVRAYTPAGTIPALTALDPDTNPTLKTVRMRQEYGITAYAPPPNARILYRHTTDQRPVIWLARAGKGAVLFTGIAPGFFGVNAQADRLYRDLVRRACAAADIPYEPSTAFTSQRGPYLAIKALTAHEEPGGVYIDLLSPDLAVRREPTIEVGESAFLKAFTPGGGPRLLAASGRVEAQSETGTTTAFTVRAPDGTRGAARLWSGTRRLKGARAWDMWGRSVPVTIVSQDDTALLRYQNRADGIVLKAEW